MSREKLDPGQLTADLQPFVIVNLMELVAEYGVPPEKLCEGLGFEAEQLRNGQPIARRQAWRLIRRAIHMTGRPDLALDLLRRKTPGRSGLPGLAATVASTFGEAVDIRIRYYPQCGGLVEPELRIDGELAVLVAHPHTHDRSIVPFLTEDIFGSAIRMLRDLLGDGLFPHSLEMAYPAPPYARRYAEIFNCPLRFNAEDNRFLFPRDWLSLLLPGHSRIVSSQLRVLLEQQSPCPAADATEAVAHVLRVSEHPNISLKVVSRRLDISARTLARRLDEVGSSFHEVKDRVLAEMAQRLLDEGNTSLTEISRHLGYSDARAFRRALKRWQQQKLIGSAFEQTQGS